MDRLVDIERLIADQELEGPRLDYKADPRGRLDGVARSSERKTFETSSPRPLLLRQRTMLSTLVDDWDFLSADERKALIAEIFEEITASELGIVDFLPREAWKSYMRAVIPAELGHGFGAGCLSTGPAGQGWPCPISSGCDSRSPARREVAPMAPKRTEQPTRGERLSVRRW